MQVVLNIKEAVASAVKHEASKEGLSLDTFIENFVETTFSPTEESNTAHSSATIIEALGNDELANYEFELSNRRGTEGEERKIDFP